MQAKEFRKLSDTELTDKLVGFRRELMNMRFQHTTSQLENTAKMPQVKKDIARVLTILNERKLAAETETGE
ncbi:MAG: 50S ribosomal protein L29 [Desulfovibrio sp.]|nr:MAG: 50S ribosomal protein L29 [Desulfovibrio sp.]